LQNEIKKDAINKTKPKTQVAGNFKALGLSQKGLNLEAMKGLDALASNKNLGTKKK
jgi:hypothetical protein